jgi:hypothetical protein
MKTHLARISLTIIAGSLFIGCGSTGSSATALTEPVLDEPGRFISRYRGPLLECLVDYQSAAGSLGGEWMALNVAVAGTQAASQEVRTDSIWIRTPDGTRIPLPTYNAFADSFGEVQSLSRRAAIAASPLDFTRGDRNYCHLSFHPNPGTDVVLTSVHVNHRKLCSGLLYFQIPGGIQPGRYAFIVKLEEADVVVPFTLSENSP